MRRAAGMKGLVSSCGRRRADTSVARLCHRGHPHLAHTPVSALEHRLRSLSSASASVAAAQQRYPPLSYSLKPPPSSANSELPPSSPSSPTPAASSPSSASSAPPAKPRSRRARYAAALAAAAAIAVAVRGPEEVQTDAIVVLRFIRTAVTFTAVAADFKWTWYNNPEGSPTYKTATAELHQRTADRLLQLAHANRGLYIKSGQYLTSMSHALPAAYITTLKPLLNEAPSMPFEDVQRLLSQEFPSTPFSSLFATFSPIPVAAASIAQVHSATLPDGTRVAVKLQYPTLDKQFHSDLLAHRLTLMATEFFFPRFHLSWMHTELAANLVQELDFVHEARNSERGARKFAETGNATVKVPRVYWTHTRRRVLTMEWVDGVKVNDKAGLEKLGVKAGDAARCAIEAMSEQIFLHGFVHCDPHGGNLFVRRKPEGSASKEPFELVILDWGLCRQMRESVRIQYCKLWTALIMRKDDDVRSAVKGLGVQGESEDDDVWELIAMSILMRPYKASSMGFSNKMSAQDMATLRQTLAHKMDKWVDAFQLMPRELLLVLRNQNYLRALNYEMGQPCNRFRVMARMALKGREWRTDAAEVAQNRIEFGDSWNELRGEQRIQEEVEARRGRLQRWWERASFELNLVYADVTRWLGMLLFQWYADPSLQQEMEQMAKRTGEEGNPLFGG